MIPGTLDLGHLWGEPWSGGFIVGPCGCTPQVRGLGWSKVHREGVRIVQPMIGKARDWQTIPLVTKREAALMVEETGR